MHRRTLLALPLAVAATGPVGLVGCAGVRPGLSGRLIVLRHAERDGAGLSAAGHARAEALPAALADLEIDAIYCTPRPRNTDTAAPLARARALPLHHLLGHDLGRRLLAAHPGETLVWVGNRENLVALYLTLGVGTAPPLRFGEIHLLDLPEGGGRPGVARRHYGA